eukprot:Clim_evm25s44 gene=Clim_evmTU25s44
MAAVSDAKENYSIVVVGEGGVGKSACTLNFIRGQFIEEYDPTIEDSYCKFSEVDGVKSSLEITDTAGQEEYRGLWGDKFMRSGEGFLLVYSITQKSSWEKVKDLYEQILRVKDTDKCPAVIIGNKCDLEEDREVSTEEGAELKEKLGVDAFMETSAKTSKNIEEAFITIARAIRDYRKEKAAHAPPPEPEPTNGTAKAENAKKGRCCLIL